MPIVVPGLPTGPPSSSTSTFSTSISQVPTADDSTPSPASSRSRSKRSRALGDQLRDSTKSKTKRTMRTSMQHWEAGRMICQSGWRNSLKTQWTKKLQHQAMHPQAFLVNRLIRNLQEEWYRNCEVCKRTTHGPLVEDALVIQYQSSCLEGIRFSEDQSIRDHSAQGEDYNEDLQGEWDGSQPIDTLTDASEARNVFLTTQGITCIVITLNQELNSLCRMKNHSQ